MINAPGSYYERVQLMVAHMGYNGFTPYEMVHTLGVDYVYNLRGQPVTLPLEIPHEVVPAMGVDYVYNSRGEPVILPRGEA